MKKEECKRNGIESVSVVNDTYCFRADGKMLTCWKNVKYGKNPIDFLSKMV